MNSSIMFGSGRLYVKDDAAGQTYQVGTLQGVTVTFEGSTKELYGSNQWPIAVAATSKKVSGKADFATIDGELLKNLFSGTVAATATLINEESLTISGSAVTASYTGSTFVEDLGVRDASGDTMQVTASAPALGYYTSDGSGSYGFNASESGAVTVSYRYNVASGKTITVSNQAMGLTKTYSLFLQEEFDGEKLGLELMAVTIPNLEMAFKNDDFATENLSFSAQADANGTVMKIHIA